MKNFSLFNLPEYFTNNLILFSREEIVESITLIKLKNKKYKTEIIGSLSQEHLLSLRKLLGCGGCSIENGFCLQGARLKEVKTYFNKKNIIIKL